MSSTNRIAFGVVVLTTLLPAWSSAESLRLRQDTVIPVVFESRLTISQSRVGDRFFAHVDRDRDLPDGTRLAGRIRKLQRASDGKPAAMELQFTGIMLPGGDWTSIDALPIPLSDKYVRRDRDGRIVAKSNDKTREGHVIGGAVAGFVIGSMIHKQVEATILGTVAGAILAESQRKNNNELVVDRGQKMGALIVSDVMVGNEQGNGSVRESDVRRDDDRDAIRISYEDHELSFNDHEAPYREGDDVMVPLERTAAQIGLSVDQSRRGVYYIEDKDTTLRLEQDSTNARLNGRRVTMTRSMTLHDGVMYVPLEIFGTIRPDKLTVDGIGVEGDLN